MCDADIYVPFRSICHEAPWPPRDLLCLFNAVRFLDGVTVRADLPPGRTKRKRIWLAAELWGGEFATEDMVRKYACCAQTVRDNMHVAVEAGRATVRTVTLVNGQPKFMWTWRG